jgi:hypothetical protein
MTKAIGLLLLQISLECILILAYRMIPGFNLPVLGKANGGIFEEMTITFIGYGYHRLLATGLAQLVILNLRNTFKNNPSKYLRENCIVSVILVFLFSLFYNNIQTVFGLVAASLIASLVLLYMVPKLKSN